jgi:hypothetical protein
MIIGYALKKIEAKRTGEISGRLDISSTPKIKDVKEKEINLAGKKKVVSVEFEFITEYKPSVAEIKISGEVYYVGKEKDALKEWKRNKKLPVGIDVEVKNFLFRKCLILGINLSQDMQLPPPIMFPMVVPKKEEEKKYIG